MSTGPPAPLSMDKLFDVAIVGYGPAGAVAAALLGAQGLSVLVCDKTHDVYEMPRAFALDHEIMRVFQQLGVDAGVLNFAEPFTPSEFYGVDGQLIKRFSTAAPPYPLAFEPSMVFSQPPVERILRAKVQGLPTVEAALGCELTGILHDEQGVTLHLRQPDNSRNQARARYLVACDGATSTVRNALGIGLLDLGFDQAWLVVDVLVNEVGLARLPQTSVQYCEPQRPSTFLIGPKNHRRWEIAINEGEDPQDLATPEGTWRLLSRWLSPQDGRLWRQASYRFHALVAQRWRVGRVFLAGDAAHQQPPFLGQGMCQGIRDVANLGWKLGSVLRGESPAGFLDSYETERKAHVIELTTRIKGIGELVGERDIAKARARDARLLEECGGVVKSVPRQNVQPALVNGFLSLRPHRAVGTPFPQPWVLHAGGKARLDNVTGTGWRLLMSSVAAAWAPRLPAWITPVVVVGAGDVNQAQSLNNAVQELDGVVSAWWSRMDAQAAIVRPDHCVYAAANSAPMLDEDIKDLMQQFAGCGSWQLNPAAGPAATTMAALSNTVPH